MRKLKSVLSLVLTLAILLGCIGNAFAVAWVDTPKGGTLQTEIDGKKVFDVPTNVPFTLIDKTKLFIENRKGIEGFSFGVHTITLKAVKAPVTLMGVYSYDTRSNDRNLRSVYGNVCDGEYTFVPAFKATPIIQTSGSLKVKSVTPEKAVFTGSGHFVATGE